RVAVCFAISDAFTREVSPRRDNEILRALAVKCSICELADDSLRSKTAEKGAPPGYCASNRVRSSVMLWTAEIVLEGKATSAVEILGTMACCYVRVYALRGIRAHRGSAAEPGGGRERAVYCTTGQGEATVLLTSCYLGR